MLEFALILPIFMFMLLFTIDMGHLILMSSAMQDATYAAATTGAQVGGAGIDTSGSGMLVCNNGTTCRAGSTYRSLTSSASQIPGYGKLGSLDSSTPMVIVHGATCVDDGVNDHVVIRTKYSTSLLTPGLGALLKMMSGSSNGVSDNGWVLTSTAAVRCQVIRSP